MTRHVVAAVLALMFLAPAYYLVVGSLRRPGTIPEPVPELWPIAPSLDSYAALFGMLPVLDHLLNSLAIAAVVIAGSVFVAALAGYALAHMDPRVSRPVLALTAVALFVPLTSLLVGRFAIFSALHVTDSFVPLWALGAVGGSPFFVLVYYWSFSRQPREMIEAAQLDGATYFETWRFVALPAAIGTTVAVIALASVLAWGAFIEPLVYLADDTLFPLTLAVAGLRQLDLTNSSILLAGGVLLAVPPLIVLAVAQRRIERVAFEVDGENSR